MLLFDTHTHNDHLTSHGPALVADLAAALLASVDDALDDSPKDPCGLNAGGAFLADSLVFGLLVSAGAFMGFLLNRRADYRAADARTATFILELAYLSGLSAAGKGLHHTIRKITAALRGPNADFHGDRYLHAQLAEQAFLTLLACVQLSWVLPPLRAAAKQRRADAERGSVANGVGGKDGDGCCGSSASWHDTAEYVTGG